MNNDHRVPSLNEKLLKYAEHFKVFKSEHEKLKKELQLYQGLYSSESNKVQILDKELRGTKLTLQENFPKISRIAFIESELTVTNEKVSSMNQLIEELTFKLSQTVKDKNKLQLKCDGFLADITDVYKQNKLSEERVERLQQRVDEKSEENYSLKKKLAFYEDEICSLQEEISNLRYS